MSEVGSWTCWYCSLSNKAQDLTCEVCSYPKLWVCRVCTCENDNPQALTCHLCGSVRRRDEVDHDRILADYAGDGLFEDEVNTSKSSIVASAVVGKTTHSASHPVTQLSSSVLHALQKSYEAKRSGRVSHQNSLLAEKNRSGQQALSREGRSILLRSSPDGKNSQASGRFIRNAKGSSVTPASAVHDADDYLPFDMTCDPAMPGTTLQGGSSTSKTASESKAPRADQTIVASGMSYAFATQKSNLKAPRSYSYMPRKVLRSIKTSKRSHSCSHLPREKMLPKSSDLKNRIKISAEDGLLSILTKAAIVNETESYSEYGQMKNKKNIPVENSASNSAMEANNNPSQQLAPQPNGENSAGDGISRISKRSHLAGVHQDYELEEEDDDDDDDDDDSDYDECGSIISSETEYTIERSDSDNINELNGSPNPNVSTTATVPNTSNFSHLQYNNMDSARLFANGGVYHLSQQSNIEHAGADIHDPRNSKHEARTKIVGDGGMNTNDKCRIKNVHSTTCVHDALQNPRSVLPVSPMVTTDSLIATVNTSSQSQMKSTKPPFFKKSQTVKDTPLNKESKRVMNMQRPHSNTLDEERIHAHERHLRRQKLAGIPMAHRAFFLTDTFFEVCRQNLAFSRYEIDDIASFDLETKGWCIGGDILHQNVRSLPQICPQYGDRVRCYIQLAVYDAQRDLCQIIDDIDPFSQLFAPRHPNREFNPFDDLDLCGNPKTGEEDEYEIARGNTSIMRQRALAFTVGDPTVSAGLNDGIMALPLGDTIHLIVRPDCFRRDCTLHRGAEIPLADYYIYSVSLIKLNIGIDKADVQLQQHSSHMMTANGENDIRKDNHPMVDISNLEKLIPTNIGDNLTELSPPSSAGETSDDVVKRVQSVVPKRVSFDIGNKVSATSLAASVPTVGKSQRDSFVVGGVRVGGVLVGGITIDHDGSIISGTANDSGLGDIATDGHATPKGFEPVVPSIPGFEVEQIASNPDLVQGRISPGNSEGDISEGDELQKVDEFGFPLHRKRHQWRHRFINFSMEQAAYSQDGQSIRSSISGRSSSGGSSIGISIGSNNRRFRSSSSSTISSRVERAIERAAYAQYLLAKPLSDFDLNCAAVNKISKNGWVVTRRWEYDSTTRDFRLMVADANPPKTRAASSAEPFNNSEVHTAQDAMPLIGQHVELRYISYMWHPKFNGIAPKVLDKSIFNYHDENTPNIKIKSSLTNDFEKVKKDAVGARANEKCLHLMNHGSEKIFKPSNKNDSNNNNKDGKKDGASCVSKPHIFSRNGGVKNNIAMPLSTQTGTASSYTSSKATDPSSYPTSPSSRSLNPGDMFRTITVGRSDVTPGLDRALRREDLGRVVEVVISPQFTFGNAPAVVSGGSAKLEDAYMIYRVYIHRIYGNDSKLAPTSSSTGRKASIRPKGLSLHLSAVTNSKAFQRIVNKAKLDSKEDGELANVVLMSGALMFRKSFQWGLRFVVVTLRSMRIYKCDDKTGEVLGDESDREYTFCSDTRIRSVRPMPPTYEFIGLVCRRRKSKKLLPRKIHIVHRIFLQVCTEDQADWTNVFSLIMSHCDALRRAEEEGAID